MARYSNRDIIPPVSYKLTLHSGIWRMGSFGSVGTSRYNWRDQTINSLLCVDCVMHLVLPCVFSIYKLLWRPLPVGLDTNLIHSLRKPFCKAASVINVIVPYVIEVMFLNFGPIVYVCFMLWSIRQSCCSIARLFGYEGTNYVLLKRHGR